MGGYGYVARQYNVCSCLLQNNEPRADPDWLNYDSVSDRFNKVDKLIDLHGHIIGMGLSPDHR